MVTTLSIFAKEYDGDTIVDIGPDLSDGFDPINNPALNMLPLDKRGFFKGRMIVTITWLPEEQAA